MSDGQEPELAAPDAAAAAPIENPEAALAPAPVAGPAVPEPPSPPFIITIRSWIRDYFLGENPTLGVAIVPMCFLSMVLFTRHPTKTNFIFDEQEALLANPYVRSVADAQPKFRWIDAFYRDFWGLPADRSIGSYRPIPNLIWRALWAIGARDQTPFLHHWVNVLFHGINGAVLTIIVFRWTKDRSTAWLTGAAFTACAVLTEAVSGVVGIADVFCILGALFALWALRLSLKWMPIGVFFGTLFGLYSKESAMCCVPLIPLAALFGADALHREKPRRWIRGVVAAVAAGAAFVLYVELRRRMFPAPLPAELSADALADKSTLHRAFGAVMRWYAQPVLPKDPLNNPLVNATPSYRVAGAMRVYVRGLWQIICPWTLSGDYSSPQEPIPPTRFSPEIIIGGLLMAAPLPAAAWLAFRSYLAFRRQRSTETETALPAGPYRDGLLKALPIPLPDRRPIIAVGLAWMLISYFPVSNIPVLLPTVRAERFWYFSAVGTSILVAWSLKALIEEWSRRGKALRYAALAVVTGFFVFQGICARKHANDYTDNLAFWDSTRKAVPRSAKAHLNYSVMKGARGDLETRREANARALELAPEWPMANIYLGDTLCRLHRGPESWPHYRHGFSLAPNDVNLIALAMQCLWDEKMLVPDAALRTELEELGNKHPGSWLDYLAKDILNHGEEHNGVDPKHRPRGYNEGPKE